MQTHTHTNANKNRELSPAFFASLPDAAAAAHDAEPLVPCPSCGRKFNTQAAERHVPKCKDIMHKPRTLRRGEGLGLGKAAREREKGGGQQQGKKGFAVRLSGRNV